MRAATSAGRTATGAIGNGALLGASAAFALLLSEGVARTMLPAPLPWRYPQVVYRADSALVFTMVPNQRGYSADKPVVINERGLRGPLVPYERTPGARRLLFLGDSITFGYGVDDAEIVSERVRALLESRGTPTEVINSAVPAYNMRQEVSYLESEGHRYRPDWVIIGVCWNDLSDKSDVHIDRMGRFTTDPDAAESLRARLRESALGHELRNLMKRSRLAYGVLEALRLLRGKPDQHTVFRTDVLEGRNTERVEAGWNDVRTQIQRVRRLAERDGFRTLVVAFPIPLALRESFPASSYPARLRQITDAEGIPFLDLGDAYRAAWKGHESLFIPYDGDHPNGEGHGVAAREIVTYLTAAETDGG